VISCEELLGIENLVWANPELALNGRRSYIDQVLGFQKEMQENCSSCHCTEFWFYREGEASSSIGFVILSVAALVSEINS